MEYLELYHGSLQEYKKDILDNGYKQSSGTHYLGDGIYFYEDAQLANKWAINKAKFEKINKGFSGNYVVFKCMVDVENKKILDLTKTCGYKCFKNFCNGLDGFKLKVRAVIEPDKIARMKATYYFNSFCNMKGIDIIKADVQLDDDFASSIRIVGLHEIQYNVKKAEIILENETLIENKKDLTNYETV